MEQETVQLEHVRRRLIIQPSGGTNFNKIVSHLNETDASFHSFCPRFRHPYRSLLKIYTSPPQPTAPRLYSN